jgi:hypothetical protein
MLEHSTPGGEEERAGTIRSFAAARAAKCFVAAERSDLDGAKAQGAGRRRADRCRSEASFDHGPDRMHAGDIDAGSIVARPDGVVHPVTSWPNRELRQRLDPKELAAGDPHHDSTLTKSEYLAVVEKQFRAADPDNDATLDAKELRSPAGRVVIRLTM